MVWNDDRNGDSLEDRVHLLLLLEVAHPREAHRADWKCGAVRVSCSQDTSTSVKMMTQRARQAGAHDRVFGCLRRDRLAHESTCPWRPTSCPRGDCNTFPNFVSEYHRTERCIHHPCVARPLSVDARRPTHTPAPNSCPNAPECHHIGSRKSRNPPQSYLNTAVVLWSH